VQALCLGPGGLVYSGGDDGWVRAWALDSGTGALAPVARYHVLGGRGGDDIANDIAKDGIHAAAAAAAAADADADDNLEGDAGTHAVSGDSKPSGLGDTRRCRPERGGDSPTPGVRALCALRVAGGGECVGLVAGDSEGGLSLWMLH